jgi:hypothetical protein
MFVARELDCRQASLTKVRNKNKQTSTETLQNPITLNLLSILFLYSHQAIHFPVQLSIIYMYTKIAVGHNPSITSNTHKGL